MRLISIFVLAFIFIGCAPKESHVQPQVIEKIIIKEPIIVEKTVYVEIPKEVCPKIYPCPPCTKTKICKPITIYKEYKKLIIGEIEEVYFPVHHLMLKARIDTGAQTSSMDAQNIVAFERDGKKWVRFEVGKGKKKISIKRPIVKTIKVKRHGEEAQDRYVVNMRLNIASLSHYTEVSLSNRSQYEFPVLIGRNYLQGEVLVDVNLQYTLSPTKEN
ncbi:MAG: hypothetical protein COA44_13465 [Arcobacter sp.]|nr:MAG: hypothetical protein COA44_13465 [Arcobacter sp.]